jgi:flagellar basal-body rod modification protein FlgD
MTTQSTVSQIQGAATAAAQQAAQQNDPTALGKDQFLKLLTTQLQYQDPTQPMDSSAFVAQLAQFSSLEQMTNVNDTLTQMLTAQSTSNAASLVGKTAHFNANQATGQIDVTQGTPVAISASLTAAAANVTMVVEDSNGAIVRTAALGPGLSGTNSFQWDGLDDNGLPVATGTYTAQLTATDSTAQPVPFIQSAVITGFTTNNGTPQFIAGGSTLQLSDISEVDQ